MKTEEQTNRNPLIGTSKPKPCDTHVRVACGFNLGDQDYKTPCMVCGAKPTVHPLELCGPCCFGEAETAGGNW